MKKSLLLAAAVAALILPSNLMADITLDNVETRTAGPLATGVTVTGGGNMGTSHANAPYSVNLTASGYDVDGDGTIDADFTFDLIATTTSANGVSVWGQGLNNSNGAGDNTSFNDLDVITMSVGNVLGTTSSGLTVDFAGFTAAGLASFDFSGNSLANRSALINGVQVDANFIGNGVGGTVQQALAIADTVVLQNSAPTSGAEGGTRILRTLDLQFTAVPEPSALAIVGLIGGLFTLRRRK